MHIIGRTISVKPGDTVDPINGKAMLRHCSSLWFDGVFILSW
jgi:hypothetical protein